MTRVMIFAAMNEDGAGLGLQSAPPMTCDVTCGRCPPVEILFVPLPSEGVGWNKKAVFNSSVIYLNKNYRVIT